MHSLFIEDGKDGRKAYKSLLLEPSKLSVLNSDLAVEIVRELTRKPSCALDIARSLQKDEQKVYYYLRKLEAAGIVRLAGMERRHGMTAKIYEAIAPVIATKLHDDGHIIESPAVKVDDKAVGLLSPFIENGRLNAVIVIGDPYSHGRFDKESHEGPYAFDFGMMLGRMMSSIEFPNYKLDTEVGEEDLKKNMILIGNIKSNVVIDRLNDSIPLHFETEGDFKVVSKLTGNSYKDPRVGVIMKFENPFAKDKKVLVLGGIGSRGSRSSIIAFTQRLGELLKGNENGSVFRVVKGYDRSGDRVIDDVEILE